MEAILNYLFEKTLIIPFLTGIIFAVTALITLRFPPKKINYLYGYRTNTSMKNQEVWDFSQRYSGIKMFQLGLIMFCLSFINVLFNFNESAQLWIGLPLLILSSLYLIFTTEKAIRKNFPNN